MRRFYLWLFLLRGLLFADYFTRPQRFPTHRPLADPTFLLKLRVAAYVLWVALSCLPMASLIRSVGPPINSILLDSIMYHCLRPVIHPSLLPKRCPVPLVLPCVPSQRRQLAPKIALRLPPAVQNGIASLLRDHLSLDTHRRSVAKRLPIPTRKFHPSFSHRQNVACAPIDAQMITHVSSRYIESPLLQIRLSHRPLISYRGDSLSVL